MNNLRLFDFAKSFVAVFSFVLLLLFASGCDCGEDDDCSHCPVIYNYYDDDSVDDDTNGDDTIDDSVDDTTPDDTEDDTLDDTEDDTDDDSADDSSDDTTPIDDDTSIDIEYISGGTFSGAAMARSGDRVFVISSKSRELRAYENVGSSWAYNVVDFGIFANPSACAESNGTLHIAYYDWIGGDVLYAEGSGSTWTTELVDDSGDVGHYSAVAADPDGFTHIAYNEEVTRATSAALKYATNRTGSWVIETVSDGSNIGSFPAIAVNDASEPYITYNSGSEIRLAGRIEDTWETSALPDGYPYHRSSGIAFNEADELNIVYHVNDTLAALRHAHGEYDSLTFDSIPDTTHVGDSLAMSIDEDDIVHVVYQNSSLAGAVYANNDGNAWTLTSLGSGYPVFITAGSLTDVAVSLGGLGVFRKSGTTWSQNYFDRGYVVLDSAAAIDSRGRPVVAFLESTYQTLRYAVKTSGSWTIQTVAENLGADSLNLDLALDTDDAAYVSFYNSLDFNLQVADNTSGSWAVHVADPSAFVGRHSALALDRNKAVHLSYSDDANGDLKYAQNTSGSYVAETVASDGLVGTWSDIVVDQNDKVTIAFVHDSDNDIKVAVKFQSVWTTQIIDAEGGDYVSVILDGNQIPHVLYVGAGLRHAYLEGSNWIIENVDPLALSMKTDAALDGNGNLTVAYQSLDWNLSVAKKTAGGWYARVIDDVGNAGDHVSAASVSQTAYISHISLGALWLDSVY